MIDAVPEVARLTADLIRFDTSNFGGGDARGEREAAEYCGAYLEALGLTVEYFEPTERRTSICARVTGRDPEKSALVVHGHLDVVPADADAWSVDPFAGTIDDGMVWGRGAVDMKNMVAMILASVGSIIRSGRRPERDLILIFFADEEDGGLEGSSRVVRERRHWFDGATEAISEVGGYSITVDGKRAYLLQVGEKAVMWLRIVARGRAGHGSRLHEDNAVTRVAECVAALGRMRWPIRLTPTTRALLANLGSLAGVVDETPDDLAARAGTAEAFLRSSFRTTANPTAVSGGYKHNVIPERADALIDVRVLPGDEEEVLAELRRVIGADIEVETVLRYPGFEAPFEGALVEAMIESLGRHDAGAPVLPYLLPAGTDNKALTALGIVGYGFAPLLLPAEFDFVGMFHGVDERVPVDSLVFGQQVLTDLFRTY